MLVRKPRIIDGRFSSDQGEINAASTSVSRAMGPRCGYKRLLQSRSGKECSGKE